MRESGHWHDGLAPEKLRSPGLGATVRFLVLSAALWGLTAGASAEQEAPVEAGTQGSALATARGLSPEVASAPGGSIPLPDTINLEIAEWARETVGGHRDPREKLQALLLGMLGPTGLQIKYRSDYTGTALEVFETRKANCLSFTHLFVATAREVGVDAYYVKVDEIASYSKKGDLVVVSNHITAGFGSLHERTILDFTVRPGVDYQSATRVADARAHALYYSNRGAERMQDGDLDGAIEELSVAIELDPGLPEAWSNLGVVRRRQGDHEAASAAYHRAIDADPEYFPAYQNLLALFQLKGRPDAAQELVRLLDKRRNRNPYSYLVLGDVSLQAKRLDEAEVFYHRARRLARKAAEPMAALGQHALTEGDREAAERWLEKARKIDPEGERVRALASSLSGSRVEPGATSTTDDPNR